jgi:hypothetical protein
MRSVVLLVASVLAASCGVGDSPPAAPSSSSLPLQSGRQLLSVVGFGMSDDPRYPPCDPLRVPYDGTNVDTVVNLQREGEVWVARSASPELGDLELRIRESAGVGRRLSGTIVGTGIDAGVTPSGIVHDVRVAFSGENGGAATVEGELEAAASSRVNGRILGRLRFIDRQGNTGTCSAIMWSLQPDRRP